MVALWDRQSVAEEPGRRISSQGIKNRWLWWWGQRSLGSFGDVRQWELAGATRHNPVYSGRGVAEAFLPVPHAA